MKVTDGAIPDDMNWADYCDALADQALFDSQQRKTRARNPVAVAANPAAEKVVAAHQASSISNAEITTR